MISPMTLAPAIEVERSGTLAAAVEQASRDAAMDNAAEPVVLLVAGLRIL